jgi:leucyl-tRNA synthetase
MFPFPSGDSLHIGHWYNYAIVDSYCKLQKYLGYDVFQPFGMDSFGLPIDNYAKKMKIDPKIAAEKNIESFMKEMERMDTSYEYKFSTHTKQYQERTQWLFSKLLEYGLAYKVAESLPNASKYRLIFKLITQTQKQKTNPPFLIHVVIDSCG